MLLLRSKLADGGALPEALQSFSWRTGRSMRRISKPWSGPIGLDHGLRIRSVSMTGSEKGRRTSLGQQDRHALRQLGVATSPGFDPPQRALARDSRAACGTSGKALHHVPRGQFDRPCRASWARPAAGRALETSGDLLVWRRRQAPPFTSNFCNIFGRGAHYSLGGSKRAYFRECLI